MINGEQTTIANTKFLVDSPLGKLAKWLRFIGFYTVYDPNLNKNEIIGLGVKSNLILITNSQKTAHAAKNAGLRYFKLMGNDISSQIGELSQNGVKINIPEITISRCSLCNGALVLTLLKQDLDQIPKNSKKYHTQFFKCRGCNQLYWEGSHWDKIRDLITKVLTRSPN